MMSWADDVFNDLSGCHIGIDFRIRTLQLGDKVLKVQLWDTCAGQHMCKSLVRSYYRGAHGTILAYDVSNAKSFNDVRRWNEEVDKYGREDVCKILVGCKCDVTDGRREVSFDEGAALAQELGIAFLETSAKQCIAVQAAVESLLGKLMLVLNPTPLVLTLMSVKADGPSQDIKACFATLAGDTFEVTSDCVDLTVDRTISSLCKSRGLRHVKLVTTEGRLLLPEEVLPGIPQRRGGSGCVAQ